MGSLQFPNMGMGLRLAALGRRSSAITNLLIQKQVMRESIEKQKNA